MVVEFHIVAGEIKLISAPTWPPYNYSRLSIEIFARHTMKFYNPFYAALHYDAKSTYSYDRMKRPEITDLKKTAVLLFGYYTTQKF